jgi:hypothetical protein
MPTLVPSAATRPSLSVAEQFGHRLLMRDRPRAALSGPLPVFPEGGCGDGGLVWVSVGNGLGRMSSHGSKGSACYRHCPGTVPRGAPVLIVGGTGSCPVLANPRPWTLCRPSSESVSHDERWTRPGLHGDRLDRRSRRGRRHRSLRSWSPRRPEADPEHRVSLLTCVGTAGFEPATP